MSEEQIKPWHVVRRSKLHGNGVFAARKIPAGTRVMEYIGAIISAKEADRRHPANPDDPFHTFFFSLSSGKVIDGGENGNDARWINHSCAPNCETQEGRHGKRVYIVALRDIARGEELFYDYGLVIDEKLTPELKNNYRCLCGAPDCRGTMLALPEKKKGKKAKKAQADAAKTAPVDAATAPVKPVAKKPVSKKAAPAKKVAKAPVTPSTGGHVAKSDTKPAKGPKPVTAVKAVTKTKAVKTPKPVTTAKAVKAVKTPKAVKAVKAVKVVEAGQSADAVPVTVPPVSTVS